MRKSIFTFIFLLSNLFLYAQEYNTAIGVKLYPGFAMYRNFPGNAMPHLLSFSGGIDVKQRIFKNKLFLETGAYLYKRGNQSNVNLTDEFGNFLRKAKFREIYSFINIPASITFQQNNFYIGGGPNVNFYLGRKFYLNDSLISSKEPYQINKIVYGCQLFAGYEKQFANRFMFSAEAFVNPTFKRIFVNYGVGIGLKYIVSRPKS